MHAARPSLSNAILCEIPGFLEFGKLFVEKGKHNVKHGWLIIREIIIVKFYDFSYPHPLNQRKKKINSFRSHLETMTRYPRTIRIIVKFYWLCGEDGRALMRWRLYISHSPPSISHSLQNAYFYLNHYFY